MLRFQRGNLVFMQSRGDCVKTLTGGYVSEIAFKLSAQEIEAGGWKLVTHLLLPKQAAQFHSGLVQLRL